VTIGGSTGHFVGQIIADGTAGLGTITLNGNATGAISAGHAKGGIKSLTIGGALTNASILSAGTAGIATMTAKGLVNGSTISATHTGGVGVKSLTVNGGVTNGTIISQGTGGVGTMTVKGNADVDLTVPRGQVGSFTLTGTSTSKLSGAWNVLGIKTFKGTLGELSEFLLTATGTIGSFTASGSMTGHSTITAATVGTLSIQGNLVSDETYAINVTGTLSAASKIDIGGTGTYGVGLGHNRIGVGTLNGTLNGQVLMGTKVLHGMFGIVLVTDSLNSTGKLKADEVNPGGWMYANNPEKLTYTSATTTGKASGILFGHTADVP
jgi:hypothetical protein